MQHSTTTFGRSSTSATYIAVFQEPPPGVNVVSSNGQKGDTRGTPHSFLDPKGSLFSYRMLSLSSLSPLPSSQVFTWNSIHPYTHSIASHLHFSHFRHPAEALDGSCYTEMGTGVYVQSFLGVEQEKRMWLLVEGEQWGWWVEHLQWSRLSGSSHID